jgi:Putative addiction module component
MSSLLTELSERAHQLQPEIEAAWDAEILKRIDEYERGEAMFSSAADVFAEARRLTQ